MAHTPHRGFTIISVSMVSVAVDGRVGGSSFPNQQSRSAKEGMEGIGVGDREHDVEVSQAVA